MEMTLDEFLADIDRWKQPVSDQMIALPVAERAAQDREARAWLESRLGRQLEVAAPSPVPRRGTTDAIVAAIRAEPHPTKDDVDELERLIESGRHGDE